MRKLINVLSSTDPNSKRSCNCSNIRQLDWHERKKSQPARFLRDRLYCHNSRKKWGTNPAWNLLSSSIWWNMKQLLFFEPPLCSTTVCTVTSISGMSSSQTVRQATDYWHRNNLIIVLERKSSFCFFLLNIPDPWKTLLC